MFSPRVDHQNILHTIFWLCNLESCSHSLHCVALRGWCCVVREDLRHTDTGQYVCRAASETGTSASMPALLTVDSPSSTAVVFHRSPQPATFPGPPGRPSVTDVTNTSARVAWRPNGNNGASAIVGYSVEWFSHDFASEVCFSGIPPYGLVDTAVKPHFNTLIITCLTLTRLFIMQHQLQFTTRPETTAPARSVFH